MEYFKTNILNDKIIKQINIISSQIDYEPFWTSEVSGEFNHFYYITDQEKILSFLGIMPLSKNSVEITGMTIPHKRRQGLWSNLLKLAIKELSLSNQKIFCEQCLEYPFTKSSVAYEDYLMRLTASKISDFDCTLESSGTEVLEYIYEYEDFTEFIYVLTLNSNPIGLLKIRQQQKTAFIHHVAIRKRFRRKGYGTILLNNALNIFVKENSHDLMLHVTSNNIAAVKLYTNTGFEIIQSLKYYRIDYLP